jgi:HD-GYP domain-containing protein (c-di-GMP phosphodiesterase class II)
MIVRSNSILSVCIGFFVLIGIYLTSLYSYLLFHTAVEMVTIVIGCGIFMLAWNSRRFPDNNYLLLLGIACLFVSFVDFLHALSYKGMGIFQGYDADLPTQLWIVARYLQSLSLLIAPFFIRRPLQSVMVFAGYALVTSLLIWSTFSGVFPSCFVEGTGLTPFKKASEYIISLILVASAVLLIRHRKAFDANVLALLILSIVLTIGAELAFTFYIGVYDISNLVGHFFKLFAFCAIYLAIIKTGLEKPYNVLFHSLKQSEGALLEAKQALEIQVTERTAALLSTNEQLQTELIERKRNEQRIQLHLDRLSSLRAIDIAIAGSLDLSLTLNVVLDHVVTRLNVDASDVLILNKHSQELEYQAGRGFLTNAISRSRLRLGEGHAGQAAFEREVIHVPDLATAETEFLRADLIRDEGFVDYHAAPLLAKGLVLGVLEVYKRTPFVPDREWLDYLVILAGQTAIAIDSLSLFDDLQRTNRELVQAYDATIAGWSHALDLRDKETEGHTQRVTGMTLQFARKMGLGEDEMVHIRRGALLHDIGKMGIPDAILLKPATLDESEWEIMRKHPVFAHEMLSPIPYLRPALDIPHYHHEKWDGTGYPHGLKGQQIPLSARLFAVADVWDALRSDRPYRKAWSEKKVMEYIQSLVGSHFDPAAVECLTLA